MTINNADQPRDHGRFAEKPKLNAAPTDLCVSAANDAKPASNVCTFPGCDRNANDPDDDDGTQTRCWTHDPDRAAAAVNDGGEVGELARSIVAHDAGR